MRKNTFFKSISYISKIVLFQIPLFALFSKKASAQVALPWETINPRCVESGVATITGIECIVTNILGIAVSGIGLASAAMFFVGSILYLTSEGNPKGVDAAKKTISYAILGIVLAISAWVILNFISVFTGNTTILKFGIEEIQQ